MVILRKETAWPSASGTLCASIALHALSTTSCFPAKKPFSACSEGQMNHVTLATSGC
jgi:hypothetical protein